jgi:hypothetical protein
MYEIPLKLYMAIVQNAGLKENSGSGELMDMTYARMVADILQ